MSTNDTNNASPANIDPREVYRWSGMDMRRRPAPSYPDGFCIEHRKAGSQWWDIAYGDAQHTAEVWAVITREGRRLATRDG